MVSGPPLDVPYPEACPTLVFRLAKRNQNRDSSIGKSAHAVIIFGDAVYLILEKAHDEVDSGRSDMNNVLQDVGLRVTWPDRRVSPHPVCSAASGWPL